MNKERPWNLVTTLGATMNIEHKRAPAIENHLGTATMASKGAQQTCLEFFRSFLNNKIFAYSRLST